MKFTGENRRTRGKTCPSVTLSTTNHTWTDPGFFFLWLNSPFSGAQAPSFRGFTITHIRHTTLGRTPLDEGPASRRDLYLTIHNRQTDMPQVGFEPTILVSERQQTYALGRTATGIGTNPVLRGDRPATNRLSHGTAFTQVLVVSQYNFVFYLQILLCGIFR